MADNSYQKKSNMQQFQPDRIHLWYIYLRLVHFLWYISR